MLASRVTASSFGANAAQACQLETEVFCNAKKSDPHIAAELQFDVAMPTGLLLRPRP